MLEKFIVPTKKISDTWKTVFNRVKDENKRDERKKKHCRIGILMTIICRYVHILFVVFLWFFLFFWKNGNNFSRKSCIFFRFHSDSFHSFLRHIMYIWTCLCVSSPTWRITRFSKAIFCFCFGFFFIFWFTIDTVK